MATQNPMDAFNAISEQITAANAVLTNEVNAATTAGKKAMGDTRTATEELNTAEQTINKEKGGRALEQDKVKSNIVNQLKVNDGSDLMASLSVSIMDTGAQMAKLRSEEQELRSVGLLDNPIQWFVNQIKLDDVAGKFNAVAGKNEEEVKQMANLTALADSRVRLANIAAATTSATEEAASIKKDAATGAIRLAAIDQAMAKMGLDTISIRHALSKDAAQLFMDRFNIQSKLIDQQLARSAAARAEESLSMQRETHDLQMKSRKDDLAAQAGLVTRVNSVLATLGSRPLGSFKEFQEISPKKQERLIELASNVDLAEGRWGPNAVAAIQFARDFGLPVPENMQGVAKYADKLEAAAVLKAFPVGTVQQGNIDWKKLTPDARSRFIRDAQIDVLKASQRVMDPADQANIYAPGLAASVLRIPALAENPIAKAYAAIPGTNPNVSFDGGQVVAIAKKLVQDGQLDIDDAAKQVSSMMKIVNQDTYEQKALQRAGVPVMKTFNVQVPAVSLSFDKNVVVDTASPQAVRNYLIRSQQMFRLREIPGALTKL